MCGVPKFKTCHVTWSRPFQRRFVIHRLGFNMISLSTIFEVSMFTHYKDTKGYAKCKNSVGFCRPYYRSRLWYSVSSVDCRLSVVCDVLYCGETVRPSWKLSEGVNRKPWSEVDFLGRRHISTSGFASTATKTAVLPYFCPYSPAIGTRWYKWTFWQQTMCILSDCAVRLKPEVVIATIIDPERCKIASKCL